MGASGAQDPRAAGVLDWQIQHLLSESPSVATRVVAKRPRPPRAGSSPPAVGCRVGQSPVPAVEPPRQHSAGSPSRSSATPVSVWRHSTPYVHDDGHHGAGHLRARSATGSPGIPRQRHDNRRSHVTAATGGGRQLSRVRTRRRDPFPARAGRHPRSPVRPSACPMPSRARPRHRREARSPAPRHGKVRRACPSRRRER